MLPLSDINPTRRFPIATVTLIAINALVFLFFEVPVLNTPREFQGLLLDWAVVPYTVTRNFDLEAVIDIVRAMFMHGGWSHLLGNMLYLWIFGDNLEDRLGIPLYLGFYLLCGGAATFAQIAVDPNSPAPMLGASGAIAGVLGGYILLFPRARIRSVVFFGFFIRFVEVQAVIVLGLWFVLQLINGLGAVGMMAEGGVAFFAHIGGFVVGMALIWVYKRVVPQPPEPDYTPPRIVQQPRRQRRERDPNDPYDKYGF